MVLDAVLKDTQPKKGMERGFHREDKTISKERDFQCRFKR